MFDADNEASSSSRRRVMSSTRGGQRWLLHGSGHGSPKSSGSEKLTFPEDLLRDIVKLALELVEELVDCRGELALSVGVLRWVSMRIDRENWESTHWL